LILETLRELGLQENTIVVFFSDHGDQLLEHGLLGKNVFFEGSVRVPFLIHYPKVVKAGRYNELMESIDIFPTLMELLGLEVPYACQGRSFLPLIAEGRGAYTPREAVFSENIIPEVFSKSYVFEKGKGVGGIRHPDAKMVRTARWKFNYYPEGFAELYDLEHDPIEQRNLAGDPAYRNTLDELKGRILDWLITAGEADQIAPRWLV